MYVHYIKKCHWTENEQYFEQSRKCSKRCSPVAQKIASMAGYGPEVAGFETARKGLDMVSNVKKNVDT